MDMQNKKFIFPEKGLKKEVWNCVLQTQENSVWYDLLL